MIFIHFCIIYLIIYVWDCRLQAKEIKFALKMLYIWKLVCDMMGDSKQRNRLELRTWKPVQWELKLDTCMVQIYEKRKLTSERKCSWTLNPNWSSKRQHNVSVSLNQRVRMRFVDVTTMTAAHFQDSTDRFFQNKLTSPQCTSLLIATKLINVQY